MEIAKPLHRLMSSTPAEGWLMEIKGLWLTTR
jgi:hypothetical protein